MSCAGRAVDIDEGLQNKLNEAESDRGDEIAWVAVRDASGLTVSGSPEWVAPQPERLRAVLATGKSDSFVVNTAQGEILIAMPPIRTHLPKNWNLLEVAAYLRGLEGALYPPRRDLWSALSGR